ncbi:MAG: type III secretion system stator protein SctL [Pseudomonadota bacterium]
MTYYRLSEIGFRLENGSGIIKAEDADALSQANTIVSDAEARARQIVADAEEHFELEKKRGFEVGQQMAERDAFERLVNEQISLDKGLAEIESSLAHVVVTSVRKIIAHYDDAQLAENMVATALMKMRRQKRLQLRVPPELMSGFEARVQKLVDSAPEVEIIDLIEDASLDAPNVVLESRIGRVDCNLGEKLEELELVIGKITRGLSGIVDDEDQAQDREPS